MYSKAIFIILYFMKLIRNIQSNEENTGLDSARDDQSLDSFYKKVFRIETTPKNKDGSAEKHRKQQKDTAYNDPQKGIYNAFNDGLYSTLNYTGKSNRYNSSFGPADSENPISAYNTRGDADYSYNLRELFKARGDLEFEDYEHLLMQGDDPNAYNDQVGVSKDGEPNVAVVTQPKEENIQNYVSGKSNVEKKVNQPPVENESNENIREHKLTPQVFARISDNKHQADDEKSEHSIAGSYIPIEKLRMRRRLSFTCSRSAPLINIDFV
jgi:hypothetical protein